LGDCGDDGSSTRFTKIVVTDDRGRYVIPDLLKANYDMWVRGYGLVDSPKVKATPGKIVDLTAVTALTPAQAAGYYPAMYWFSLDRNTGQSYHSRTQGLNKATSDRRS
jgi:hypothetical protein